MGRTVAPFSAQIEVTAERFASFRRALRKDEQKIFDRLFRSARLQMQAGVMAACPNPFDSMAMSMLIELQRQNDELRRDLDRLKEKSDGRRD